MAKIINPLAWNVPIVDPKTGYPTEYFKRILEDISEARISASLVEALGGDPDENQVVTWDDTADDLAFKPASDVLDMIDDTHGAILYRDSTEWLPLAPGTDGDVLTTHGASADPTWETPSAGGSGALTLIEEKSPTGVATVTFASIPGTYRDLVLVCRVRGTNATNTINIVANFNNDTGANYNRQRIGGTNTTVSGAVANETSAIQGVFPGNSATANVAGQSEMVLYNYAGTTFFKTWMGLYGGRAGTANSDFTLNMLQGTWHNTAAITEIDVSTSAGNFATGSVISLYGRM